MSPAATVSYIVYSDGGARGNPGPAAVGFVILDEDQNEIIRNHRSIGDATNNVAEYQAVIDALSWLSDNRLSDNTSQFIKILCYLDSQLVVNQLSGAFKIKKPHLYELASKIHQIVSQKQLLVSYKYIPREDNAIADSLVNQSLDGL